MLALLAVPYLPWALLAIPAGAALEIQGGSPSGGWVSSRGPDGDDAPAGPSNVFSKAEVKERSRDWEVKRLEGCGWRLMLTKVCAIRGDVPVEDLRAVGVHADAFIATIENVLAGDSTDLRFSVRAFRDRHAFDVYASCAGAKGADSFYDVKNAEAVVHWPAKDAPWRLLMHELTHAYLDRVLGRREPLWLAEGLAEYFASYTVEKGSIVPGGPHESADEKVRRAREEGSFIGLRLLLAAGRDTFYGETHALHYAEAGSLLRFIARNQGGTRERAIWELARGKGLHTLWDLDELESSWTATLKK